MRDTVLSFLMASIGVSLAQTLEVQEVVAPVGNIRGSFMKSRSGRRFFAARGVRYGEPPVGEMRFKQAVPATPWTNVFDASQGGPSCPQPGGVLPSEDCLGLNIYTPELPNLRNTAKTGNPIPKENEEFKDVIWEPFTMKTKKHLDIGNTLTMKTETLVKRMKKWNELFPCVHWPKSP